ncbi:unnamed protein product, partial [Ectocarpus fasciculatus]
MMPTPWVDTLDIRDPFTGWTPAEFSEKFYGRYGEHPEFYSAGGFASGIVLMDAIQRSQSMDPAVIAQVLRESTTQTIYGEVSFNEDNMYAGDFLTVQVQRGSLEPEMVLPTVAPNTTLVYPMPTWTQKQCAHDTNDCDGHGACSSTGVCECEDRYYGAGESKSC